MMYPLVRGFAAKDARILVPVAVACLVLRFSEQDFYAWLTNPVTGRDWSDAHLTNAAVGLHAEDPGNGYRFIFDERPAHGIAASERRVWRLCSQQRLWSHFFKKRGLKRKAGPPVRPPGPCHAYRATKKVVLLSIAVFIASHHHDQPSGVATMAGIQGFQEPVNPSLETPQSCRSR